MSSNKWWYLFLGTVAANTAHQIKENYIDAEDNVSRLEIVGDRVASRNLLKAAYSDDVELFAKSLEKGNINARNENGDNFLMIAIENNSNKILEYAMNEKNGVWKNIDISNVNNDGKTAQSMVNDKLNSVIRYIDGSSKDTLNQLKQRLGQKKSDTSMAFYESGERSM